MKISSKRVKEIIKEELLNLRQTSNRLDESIDHAQIKELITHASKLLDAAKAFQEKAPAAALNAVTPGLSEMIKMLEEMITSPGSYVVVAPKRTQKVSFKPTGKNSVV